MLYLIIGLFVAAAIGTMLQKSKQKPAPPASAGEGDGVYGNFSAIVGDGDSFAQSPGAQPAGGVRTGGDTAPQDGAAAPQSAGLATIIDNDTSYDPVLAAKPISSPSAVTSATYSSPSGDDSPYAYGSSPDAKAPAPADSAASSSQPGEEPKQKSKGALLRWSGRTGSVQVGGFVILGPVTYWSDGPSSVEEPSCIDITLPVEYPEGALPAEGAESYAAMTPVQRGIYLTWLAGGRIQQPPHMCYPSIWLCGLERRVIMDKLDMGLCLAEAFRMLPLMRWEALRTSLINFITWLAVKIWLPEDELLNFCKKLLTVPDELLGMLLGSYAISKLPLPSSVAFTLVRTSATLRKSAFGPDTVPQIVHSDELLQQFTPKYKNACSGGLVLTKPKSSSFLSYKPINQSFASQKDGSGGVVEMPNFFEDTGAFDPVVKVWANFITDLTQKPKVSDGISDRPDFEGFVTGLDPDAVREPEPMMTTLRALGVLFGSDMSEEKVHGRDRKMMTETAQVEGWQIVPDLGISGREYAWDDDVLLLPLELGAKLSGAYHTASLLLEFICALTNAREQRLFEQLRQRMNDYFRLTTDDNVRLEAQHMLMFAGSGIKPPEFYGDFIQVWLQDDERSELRDVIFDCISIFPQISTDEAKLRICTALAVPLPPVPDASAEQPQDGGQEPQAPTPQQYGDAASKLLAPLFRNS